MNFHSDLWIQRQVYKHLKEAQTLIEPSHIVGIFYHGSGNYGLDYEGSDVDTKCITTPTLKEIALNKKPLSTTHVRENNEHIDLKDIRLYIQTFRKQNLNFLEILYTPYFYLPNENFVPYWNELIARREEITHYDRVRSVKSMLGIASEKYFAMEHHYPARMEWINRFGYDPKQLHHLLRVSEYLHRYLNDEPYGDCLISEQPDFLKYVKEGNISLFDARLMADATYQKIKDKCNNFIEKYKNEPVNKEIDEFLDEISYQIMKESIREDLNEI